MGCNLLSPPQKLGDSTLGGLQTVIASSPGETCLSGHSWAGRQGTVSVGDTCDRDSRRPVSKPKDCPPVPGMPFVLC